MPLPTRNIDESHEQFIARCMADPVMVHEFPDAAAPGRLPTAGQGQVSRRPAEPGERAGGDHDRGGRDGEGQATASRGCRGFRWSPTRAGRCGSPAGVPGDRGPGRAGHPLPEPADPLRPRHAERRRPHRRDPGRRRQAAGRRRGLPRHGGRPGDRRHGRNGFPWQASIGAVGRGVRVRQAHQKAMSTAGSSPGR